MSILAQLADDMDAPLADWGETIQYFPHSAESLAVAKSIQAIVDRELPEGLPGGGRTSTQVIRFRVKNDFNEGILASQINLRGDKVAIPLRVGGEIPVDANGELVKREIKQILSQDDGMLYLEC